MLNCAVRGDTFQTRYCTKQISAAVFYTSDSCVLSKKDKKKLLYGPIGETTIYLKGEFSIFVT